MRAYTEEQVSSARAKSLAHLHETGRGPELGHALHQWWRYFARKSDPIVVAFTAYEAPVISELNDLEIRDFIRVNREEPPDEREELVTFGAEHASWITTRPALPTPSESESADTSENASADPGTFEMLERLLFQETPSKPRAFVRPPKRAELTTPPELKGCEACLFGLAWSSRGLCPSCMNSRSIAPMPKVSAISYPEEIIVPVPKGKRGRPHKSKEEKQKALLAFYEEHKRLVFPGDGNSLFVMQNRACRYSDPNFDPVVCKAATKLRRGGFLSYTPRAARLPTPERSPEDLRVYNKYREASKTTRPIVPSSISIDRRRAKHERADARRRALLAARRLRA